MIIRLVDLARAISYQLSAISLQQLGCGAATYVFVAGLLAACGGPTPTPTPVPTATATPGPTATATATHTPSATPTPTFPADAVVLVDALNLRAGPDTLHPVLDGVRAATPVAIRGRNDDGSWLAVRLPNMREGWLSSPYVEVRRAYETIPTMPTPSPPPTPTPTPVPMDPAAPLALVPPAVGQGDPFLVRLRVSGASQVIAALAEDSVPLLQVGPDLYAGVLAASADLPPGAYSVHITTIAPDGEPGTQAVTLHVHDAGFGEEDIELADETSRLLDPSVREPELAVLTAVWSAVTPEKLWHGAWSRPVTGTVSSPFGTRRNYKAVDATGWHTGVDLRGQAGSPVLAPARGRVALAQALVARGKTVWLDHGWGIFSGYFHLTEIGVEPGALVERGQTIGTIGSTGMSTGPHLHWEVRVQGVATQPLQWLLRDVGYVP